MKSLNKYIDHTVLKPSAQKADIEKLCKEAREHDFATVCVNPHYLPLAKKLLEGTDVGVAVVIGFPLGMNDTRLKGIEAEMAVDAGATELDMVINVGALKDGDYDFVRADIKNVVEHAKGVHVKVIIESGLLTDEEIVAAVKCACEAGAHYVKTCTGFGTGSATVHAVELMKANCAEGVLVKASGGIRSYEAAMDMIAAGADRLGTSSGIAIMEGERK